VTYVCGIFGANARRLFLALICAVIGLIPSDIMAKYRMVMV
jgi:hypothetical protein